MRTPSRAPISGRSLEIVQLVRSATGASSNGAATRKAASLFTGTGPGATLIFKASTPPAMKALRQKRTVSCRTPNASSIVEQVQPASVSNMARARSASPRSQEPERANRAARCASLAVTGDLPDMPPPANQRPQQIPTICWSINRKLLRLRLAARPRWHVQFTRTSSLPHNSQPCVALKLRRNLCTTAQTDLCPQPVGFAARNL
jgi:hypothetical protein